MKNIFEKHFFGAGWLNTWRPYFLIFIIGFLLYAQTLSFDFTYFDDNSLILEKQEILQDFKNVGQLFSADVFFSGSKFYYRPLLNLSFMIDAQLGGESLFFYHFSNILMHLFCVALLFCLLKKISGKSALSFFLSLVFLVHPVLTQAVAWLPGRNDSLLTIFILLSFISFLNFLNHPRLKSYIAYLVFLFFALLSKETAVFLPVLVIFYFWFVNRGKINFYDKSLLILGSLATGFIWFLMRSFALGREPVNYFSAIFGIINNLPAVLLGIGKLIFPFNLSVLPVLADSTLFYGVITLVILILALYFSRHKRNNYLVFGLIWFIFFLLPSFIRLNTLSDFLEHRLYLPFIGFLIMLIEIDYLKNLDFTKKKVKIGAFIILIIFSALTWCHSHKFNNRLTFWISAAKSSPHSPLAQRNLGAMYYLDGQLDLAEIYYLKAIVLNPNEEMVHNNLGLIYLDQGNYFQAESEFNKELAVYPTYDKALFNLGLLRFKTGNFEAAKDLWQKTLEINPGYYEADLRLHNLEKTLR